MIEYKNIARGEGGGGAVFVGKWQKYSLKKCLNDDVDSDQVLLLSTMLPARICISSVYRYHGNYPSIITIYTTLSLSLTSFMRKKQLFHEYDWLIDHIMIDWLKSKTKNIPNLELTSEKMIQDSERREMGGSLIHRLITHKWYKYIK